VTNANPNPHPHPHHAAPNWRESSAWRAKLNRWLRAGRERSLVMRRRGIDHVRLPMNLVVLLSLVLAVWSWPVLVLAIVVALVAQVEFVVQRDTPA
jgi:hypothetical protein